MDTAGLPPHVSSASPRHPALNPTVAAPRQQSANFHKRSERLFKQLWNFLKIKGPNVLIVEDADYFPYALKCAEYYFGSQICCRSPF